MFTHLRAASGFSLRYGASHPHQLAERAAELGMSALALTDRDTVGGAVRHAAACTVAGLRPVFGADLAVARLTPTHPGGPTAEGRSGPVKGGAFVDESAPRAVFLARDAAGWASLCALITAAHAFRAAAGGGQPVVPRTALEVSTAGLTVLLGPDSEIAAALVQGRPDLAEQLLLPWRELYGPALRLEAVHLGRPGTGAGSPRLAARTVRLAADLGVECVLSNAVRYATAERAPIADVLDSARLLTPIQPGRTGSPERYLKSPAQMAVLAREVADAAGLGDAGAAALLTATESTAAACRLDPVRDLGIGSVHFPEERLAGAAPGQAGPVLRSRCEAVMASRRYDRSPTARRRLAEELSVIETLGWPSYLLTVAQVVEDTRALGIRVSARGSGAGSLVCHLLGIATAMPLDHGLIMERFLNVRRKSLPDIDLDVESARRLEVYRAILDRYGPERVALVSMPETWKARGAIRTAGLALGLPPDEVGQLAKAFPHFGAAGIRQALAELPELRALAAQADRYGKLWELAEGLDGLHHGISAHPCGVLLSDDQLLQRTPVIPTPTQGLPMSVFDKHDVEPLGFLKLDVLGVRMISAMTHAVAEVARVTGESVDLDTLPLDDGPTFELLREGESLAVFQLESPGQRQLLGQSQPQVFEDLIAQISLFRPGPVEAKMIPDYIRGRHGAPIRYPHPDLEPVLRGTYGVVIFNEQVTILFAIMTGTDLAYGEEARRALSTPDRLPNLENWYRTRAAAKGYTPEVVDRVWQMLKSMGSYGFAKAHAVAFAVPTYQSAWLKTHHPAALYAGVLEHDPGMYPQRALLSDARRRGVPILPLDVQHSSAHYRIEPVPGRGLGLRMSLRDIRGITEDQAERIEVGQPYADVPDFWQRARPTLPVAQHLARTGALDTLAAGSRRREILLLLDELHQQHRPADGAPQQLALTDPVPPTGAGLPEMGTDEELQAELDAIGMDASRNLMADHHPLLERLGVTSATALADAKHGATVLVAGTKIAISTPRGRNGGPIFVTLDDGTAGQMVDLVVFQDSQERCADTVFHRWLLLVRGTVARKGRSVSVVATTVWDLAQVAAAHQAGGTAAVRDLLAPTTDNIPAAGAPQDGRPGGAAPAWGEVPGLGSGGAGRLWHASPGSAG
ncbi:DNA polymerase III subunit alpha [Kitasatospora sp. NPDC101801]|uniref:DNA polymerase III subunit alpha n=1 Tax=Kitasatospora sp. NPDC101801 TaxID=3364103 RepID=UPI0038298B88